ncbi:MAG: hypothetical protein ABIB79_04035 [archaeon]
MPRLTIDQLFEKVHSGKWGSKKHPKTLWCPGCHKHMEVYHVDKSFISGDGIYYECINEDCGHAYSTIGNA